MKDFSKIPDLYVITITNFDIFGKNSMVYHFHNQCIEYPELAYHDGLHHIYFYTKGEEHGSHSIHNMLRYIEDSHTCNVVDEATEQMDYYVNKIRNDAEMEGEYMTFGDLLDRERIEGKTEGEFIKLTKQIVKKMNKQLSVQEIAEQLEETEEDIQKLYDIITEIGIDASADEILEKYLSIK